jgi:hypothetical protein
MMSNLRHADYTQHLAGKVVRRVRWSNYGDENWHALSIEFEDNTLVSFRFALTIDEQAELSDFIGGNLSHERKLTPLPVRSRSIKQEGE